MKAPFDRRGKRRKCWQFRRLLHRRGAERLDRFLAITGLEPAQIRDAAREPGFLVGVLEHMLGDESFLLAFAASAGIDPAEIARARGALGGRHGNARCRERLLPRLPRRRAPRGALRRLRLAADRAPRRTRTLSIAHVDCDAFYATIEKRDDPSLAAEPVIVGGGRRGVVAAACYVARTYGVKIGHADVRGASAVSARPRRAAQHGEILRVGREVRRMMLALTPLVEPLSIDEAFLDLSGTERLHGMTPAKVLARFAARRREEARITVSIGLSCNKFLAKIASDLDKPRGFAVLGADEAQNFPAPKPVGFIFGVGKVSAARLARDGFRQIADLQKASEIELMRRYGEEGRRLARLARGIDSRKVSPSAKPRAFRRKRPSTGTLPISAAGTDSLGETEKVSARLKQKDLAGATVTLKLKTADFKIRTRALSFGARTQLALKIFAAARELLLREIDGTKFRLLGVGVSALADAEEADPADFVDRRAAEAEHAVDRVRARFGDEAVLGVWRSTKGEKPKFVRLVTGLCFLEFQRRQRADNGEVVVVERQRPGQAIFVEFETYRIDRRLLAVLFGLALVEIAYRNRPSQYTGELRLVRRGVLVLALIGGEFTADDGQRVINLFAGIRSVENRKVENGLAGPRGLDNPQHMLCREHDRRIQINDLLFRLDQIDGGRSSAVLGVTVH